ncbi:MAG: PadR family transcriptional regulator [Anaerolineae bacterium]|nr:PadR family transcriptional regulator [Anaerolineae bacterium]
MSEQKLLLLGVLRRNRMHGYQLNEFIEREMAHCSDLKKPTAYFLLKQMAKDGWIQQHTEPNGNRPPRRVYQLTDAGEAQYQRLLRENLASYYRMTFPGDIGIAFSDVLDTQETLTLLANRRAALVADLEAARGVPDHGGSLQFLIQHRVFHLEAELRWLDMVIAQLETSAHQPVG